MSSEHFARASVLIGQNRFDLAEKELRQALAGSPDHATAHALLAQCLLSRDEWKEAASEAGEAVRLAPEAPFGHCVLAQIHLHRNRLDDALASIGEAVRLDPSDAALHAMLSGIRLARREWPQALEAAERGLALDAEHVGCNNSRATALVQLGRREEAGATLQAALARDPDNAHSHANRGWALLHEGRHQAALEHFREALRLEPDSEWAREGVVESLKSRYFIYRWLLRWMLWMSRLSNKAQWAVILGAFVGIRALRAVAKAHPEFAIWILPISAAYSAFVLLTWLADPLFNLLLRLNRYGRMVLSPDQIRSSNWIGGTLAAGILLVGIAWTTRSGTVLLGAVFTGILALPVAAVFRCEPGWPRRLMVVYTLLLVGFLAGGFAFLTAGPEIAIVMFGIFAVGAFLNGFVANGLATVRVKR